jgi:PAS domain S-box-containing protein
MRLNLPFFRSQTVHGKLLMVIMLACIATMLVAGLAIFAFLGLALRHSFERDSWVLARIMASNCRTATAAGDVMGAKDMILSLYSDERIVGAMIRLPNGDRFVEVGHTNGAREAWSLRSGTTWLSNTKCVQVCPILDSGKPIGTLMVFLDFGPVYLQLLEGYIVVLALTAMSSIVLGLAVASRARRFISDPIRSLVESVWAGPEGLSRSVPACRAEGGEVGQLADAFNTMRRRVEQGESLAKEVAERRRVEEALRQSEEQFRSLFQNAHIGLYRLNREGRFVMANQALINLLGYSTFEEVAALDIKQHVCVDPHYRAHFSDCIDRFHMVGEIEVEWRRRDGRIIHVRESAKAVCNAEGAVLWCEGCVEDITARKEAAAELQRLHRELLDASHAAGMAEVATGVLHNVGNVLNSVSVSAQLVFEEMGVSKVASLQQAVALMEHNLPQLGPFLAEDKRGKLLPDFLIKVSQHVAAEQARWHQELHQLKSNIDHMKEIVAMQQDYARVSGQVEPLSAADLLDDALRMNQAGLERHKIVIKREYGAVPHVLVDRHKVLQILINLIRNAKYAMDETSVTQKRLDLKVCMNDPRSVKMIVRDNGVGIPQENLVRIFSHGFTTRREGHGFGLHSGFLAAQQLGGTLEAHSDGAGQGAAFTLVLPIQGSND